MGKLSDDTLAKTALLENTLLRTNWIMTIEKLMNLFNLTDLPGNLALFKIKVNKNITEKFIRFWKGYKKNETPSRMQFYNEIKTNFAFEEYLDLPNFSLRKIITKFRCSDHTLEIERGRHNNIPREERVCKVCDCEETETEEHFLIKCKFYETLKSKYQIRQYENSLIFLCQTSPACLGRYLIDAFAERKTAYEVLLRK